MTLEKEITRIENIFDILTRISILRRCKRKYDVVRLSYVVKINCLTLDSNIQHTDVKREV